MAPVTQLPNVESVTAINIVVYFLSLPLFILYLVVLSLASIGFLEIMFKFNPKSRRNFDLLISDDDLEPVTILRPLKGIDTEMMICAESSFEQNYPRDKFEILFCVQDENDPAVKIAQDLIAKYPETDAKLMIDFDQDHADNYGPNPKINNLAKGYKNAKHDLLWVLDSNVWTRPDTLKRSVYTINHNLQNGLTLRDSKIIDSLLGGHKKVKLVNHVPLAISLDNGLGNLGCKLDQMFLSTSHSKFYVALNKIQPAPCVNGKSNIYRRSDLDLAVYRMSAIGAIINPSNDGMSGDLAKDAKFFSLQNGEGIRFFARYIGEDNMIAIALWNFVDGCAGMSKDCVIQPLDGENTILNYADRRIRWLRVRKYMVLAATALEPTTECLLSGIIGSFCISVAFLNKAFSWNWFMFHFCCWLAIDCIQCHSLFKFIVSSMNSTSNLNFPFFLKNGYTKDLINLNTKSVIKFIPIWLLREALAFPIWVVAVVGSRIDWRGQPFKIKADLSAERL